MKEETLNRFLIAQDAMYKRAIKEIQEGKLSCECWIRYIFPQLKRSGTSKLTEFYGLNGRKEAAEYINHPILKERLIKAAQVILDMEKPIFEIFSNLGVLKIRSCMLLFASICNEPIFKKVIQKYKW
jgi:uncharacterized protein (DUF1810 family)